MSSSNPTFDRESSLWTVQDYGQIEVAFTCPHLNVRPSSAPVLPFLIDTRAGMIFGNLARMSDGEDHRIRRVIATALIDSLPLDRVGTCTQRASELLMTSSATVHDWQVGLSSYSLGLAFGIEENRLPELAFHVASFTRAISPGGTQHQLADGITAAEVLWTMMSNLRIIDVQVAVRDVWIANMIGLFFQAHDSMAGLLGNALIYVQRHPEVTDMRQVIRQVLRESPPICNTRRFTTGPVTFGEIPVVAGETIVLDLEHAMRMNPDAPSLGFGSGTHQCPGQVLAFTIAASALEHGPRINPGPEVRFEYHPLPNANIPDLRGFSISGAQT